MKRKKVTKKVKKKMFAGTFDKNAKTRYARKKILQGRGIFSSTSPCRFDAVSVIDPKLI